MSKHTPGPWRWELNEKHKSLHLVGGRPQFDLTILQPVRWGTSSATLFIRDTAYDGMNLLHKLHERRDWIAPFEGRKHHVDWCADVTHPDMRLIAAAPELLTELVAAERIILVMLENMTPEQKRAADEVLTREGVSPDGMTRYHERRAVIAKATGA